MLENFQFDGVMQIEYWNLPPLLYQAFYKGASPSNCIAGFRTTGIWPLQTDWCDLNQDKIIPSEIISFKTCESAAAAGGGGGGRKGGGGGTGGTVIIHFNCEKLN